MKQDVPILKSNSPSSHKIVINDEKYALFNKWLKDQQDAEEKIKNKLIEDNSLKEIDEFLDAEDAEDASNKDIAVVQEENVPVVSSVINATEKEITLKNESELLPEVIKTIEENSEIIVSEIVDAQDEPQKLLQSSATLAVSTNDLSKKHACHNKGKAPTPPSPSMLLTKPVQDHVISSAGNSNETINEKCDDDKKPKKTLMNYLPSILRPISPSNSSKNIPKETDI